MLDGRRLSAWEREPRKYEERTLARFYALTRKEDECILWAGSLTHDGYGRFSYRGTNTTTHRWIYAQVKGAIPKGMELDHLCRNRACVNPDHLEVVTHGENMRRGDLSTNSHNGNKTHCPHGHEYTEDNTYIINSKQGRQRKCRTCVLERMKKTRATNNVPN